MSLGVLADPDDPSASIPWEVTPSIFDPEPDPPPPVWTIAVVDGMDTSERPRRFKYGGLQSAVFALIEDWGTLTTLEVSAELGITVHNAGYAIRRLVQKGVLVGCGKAQHSTAHRKPTLWGIA